MRHEKFYERFRGKSMKQRLRYYPKDDCVGWKDEKLVTIIDSYMLMLSAKTKTLLMIVPYGRPPRQ